MKPATYDITIYQGATYYREFVWKTGDPATPVDLTGCTARMHARRHKRADSTIIEATTDNGQIELVDAVNGKLALSLPADYTDTLPEQCMVYDLEIEFPDGTVWRLLEGEVTVDPQVTR